jgi:hypothetical protein
MENSGWCTTEKVAGVVATGAIAAAGLAAMVLTRELDHIIPAAETVWHEGAELATRIEQAMAKGPRIFTGSPYAMRYTHDDSLIDAAQDLFPVLPKFSQAEIRGFVAKAANAGLGKLEKIDAHTEIGVADGRGFVFRSDLNQTVVRTHPFAFSVIDHNTGATDFFHRGQAFERLTFPPTVGQEAALQAKTIGGPALRRVATNLFYSAEANRPLGSRISDLQIAFPHRDLKFEAEQRRIAGLYHAKAVELVRAGAHSLTDDGKPFFRVRGGVDEDRMAFLTPEKNYPGTTHYFRYHITPEQIAEAAKKPAQS